MMRILLTKMLILLWMGTATAWAGEGQAGRAASPPSQEDMKVIAVMDILQMLEMTEDMDMIKDLEYLIEDDQDESKKD